MLNWKRIHWRWYLLVALAAIISVNVEAAYRDTAANWKCYNSVSGSWTFGRAPYGCDVSAFANATAAQQRYQPVIFNDQVSSKTAEQRRFMQEMLPLVRDTAVYYLKIRKPNASTAETNAWIRAAYAISHQESYWSHYRKASDGRLKMMRGDYGHGHGLMQVDDRWHYPALQEGKGWNLVENITYSLDEYYAAWQRAPSQSCVSSASDWKSRARAAYSAYNGGPSKICRWTNPKDTWARNDIGFLQKWNARDWEDYVADLNRNASLDVPCLINGGNNCSEPDSGEDLNNALIKLTTGEACVLKDDTMYCIESDKHATCLAGIASYDASSVIQRTPADVGLYDRKVLSSHDVCQSTVNGLFAVTDVVTLTKNNVLRATPGGLKLLDIPADSQLQILDFAVTNTENFNRFYRVQFDNQVGFIWGGDHRDFQDWLTTSASDTATSLELGRHGQWIQINNDVGVNLRTAPQTGQVLTRIPKDAIVLVKDVLAFDSENKLYYQVEYKGVDGYIYGGFVLGNGTVENWASVVSAPQDNTTIAAVCPNRAWYDATVNACVDELNTYGPFPAQLTERCKSSMSSSHEARSCDDEFEVVIDGVTHFIQRWNRNFHRKLAQDTINYQAVCPFGATPSASYGFHCVDEVNNTAQNVFGPFSSAMVETCWQMGMGDACYLNRWAPSVYSAVINASDLNTPDQPDEPTDPEPPQQSGYPLCPVGSTWDKTLGFCASATHGYGPFPQAMVDGCVNSDGGPACTEGIVVDVDGHTVSIPRWSINYVRGLRGTNSCPTGTRRVEHMSNRCVEYQDNKPVNVYGPFSETLVKECVAKQGGDGCYLQRWSAAFYAWVDADASLEPPVSSSFPYYNQNYNASEGWRACNITSISMALDFYGITSKEKLGKRTPDYIYKKYYLQFTMEGLKRIFDSEAKRVGSGLRDSITYGGTVSALRARAQAGIPTVVHGWFTGAGHIVEVIGFDGSNYIVHDPNGRWNERYKGGYVTTRTGGRAVHYSKAAFERAIDRGGIWMHRFN